MRPAAQRTARRGQAGTASPRVTAMAATRSAKRRRRHAIAGHLLARAYDDVRAAKVGFSLVAESWGKTRSGCLGNAGRIGGSGRVLVSTGTVREP
mgnify:CR=1 FL=1